MKMNYFIRLYYFGGFGVPIEDRYLNECGDFELDEDVAIIFYQKFLN